MPTDDAPPEPEEIEYFLFNHESRCWQGPWFSLHELLQHMSDEGLVLNCHVPCPVAERGFRCTVAHALAGVCNCEPWDGDECDVYVDVQVPGGEWGEKVRTRVTRFPRAFRNLVRFNDSESFWFY